MHTIRMAGLKITEIIGEEEGGQDQLLSATGRWIMRGNRDLFMK